MTVQLPSATRLPVAYVDHSPSGRAAFRATHAAALRVNAVEGSEIPDAERVVVVRDRGGPGTRDLLEALRDRTRVVVVDRQGVADAEVWCAAGLCEHVVVMPSPPSAVVRLVRTAWQEDTTRRQVDRLLDQLVARDRAASVAALRGKILHDLANLATAASMDAEILRRAASDDADVEEMAEVCARMLAVHQRSRLVSSTLVRAPQLLSAREVAELAAEIWQVEVGVGRLEVGPEVELVHGDRGDVARILVGLGRLARDAGGPPRITTEVASAGGRWRARVGPEPDAVAVLLLERLAGENRGRAWTDGDDLVVELPAAG